MRLASRCLMMGLLVGGAAWATDATASTTLKDIHAETLPGGRVALHLDFANGPVLRAVAWGLFGTIGAANVWLVASVLGGF